MFTPALSPLAGRQHPLITTGQFVSVTAHQPEELETSGSDTLTPETSRPPRALVVDDAPDVTEMLGVLLQYAGYEVASALSGAQALRAAHERHFDVIVSDIGMPEMNGYELALALRRLPGYETTPLIAVTGFTLYDDRDRAIESGFSAFLTKPINPKDLLTLVERLQS